MKTKRIIKDQKGVAAVEFAIVLPLLVLLLVGIIEASICFYNKQVITNASREAARAGIGIDPNVIGDPDTYLRNIVDVYCFGDGNNDGYNDEPRLITFGSGILQFPACGSPSCIKINDGDDFANPVDGIYLKISVEYAYTFLIPEYIGLGTSMTLMGQTVMRMF